MNLVVLSFVNPLKLLNRTTDSGNLNGIPVGMNQAVVNYFKSRNIRVMLSIGGITYTNDWNTALRTNPTQLGANAAAVAQQLGVDRSYVSRVANGQRRSAKIEKALLKEINRIERLSRK